MRLLISSTPKILPSLLDEFHPWVGTLVTPRNGALRQAMRLWESHGCWWAADNDAFSGFDPKAYRRMLDGIAGLPGCLFVTVPDLVGTSVGTYYRWLDWAWPVEEAAQQPLAFVIQDHNQHTIVPWGEFDALFVGGTTEWKLSRHCAALVREAKARGKHVHYGRANSERRYRVAHDLGAGSVDGTNVCRFPDAHLPRFLRLLRKLDQERPLYEANHEEGVEAMLLGGDVEGVTRIVEAAIARDRKRLRLSADTDEATGGVVVSLEYQHPNGPLEQLDQVTLPVRRARP